MIAITAGDPCGVGPEVILKALRTFRTRPRLPVAVIGDAAVFSRAAARLRSGLPPWVRFIDCGHPDRFLPGRSSRAAGAASLAYLRHAVALWRAGRLCALVTAPVTKWAVQRVDPAFVGHTEYLAAAMHRREVVMLFASETMRVAVVTRHVPLRCVPRAITQPLLRRTLTVTAEGLRDYFRIRRPRLAVCGLNPHAGEGPSASEERTVFQPAIRALRRRGITCDGPLAADGFFASRPWERYDAVICAYHDQGLIPFKLVARDRGCQMTLGLPIVRTSPDHGSALDIAGQGVAHPGSMAYALRLAIACSRPAS